jgi:putative transposase
MSRNYKFHDQEKPYFISFAIVYWLDVFIRPIYKDILVDSMNYCIKEKGLIVYAWVIMSSHVHMIIGTRNEKMQDIVRDLKKYTSKAIINAIKENIQESRREWLVWMFERAGKKNTNNTKYQFWQQHNKPIELHDNEIIAQKLHYLHSNPVEEGFVHEPHEYKYSSAVDYSGGKGYVDVEIIS